MKQIISKVDKPINSVLTDITGKVLGVIKLNDTTENISERIKNAIIKNHDVAILNYSFKFVYDNVITLSPNINSIIVEFIEDDDESEKVEHEYELVLTADF